MTGSRLKSSTQRPNLAIERVLGHTIHHNSAVAVHPGTGRLAYPAGLLVIVYDPERHRQTDYFRTKQPVSALAFSPCGRFLATGERGHAAGVSVFGVETGELLAHMPAHRFGVGAVAFSHDSATLLTAGFKADHTVAAWEWRTGSKLGTAAVEGKIFSLACSADGSFCVAGGEPTRGSGVLFLPCREGRPQTAAASGPRSSELLLQPAHLEDFAGHAVTDVACGTGPSGSAVFACTATGFVVSVLPSRLLDRYTAVEAGQAYAVSAAHDRLLVACDAGVVRCFDASTLEYVTTLPAPPLLSAGAQGADAKAAMRQSLASFDPGTAYPAALCTRLSHDGNRCSVVYADSSIAVWDVTNPARRIGRLRVLAAHAGPVRGVCCPSPYAVLGPAPGLGPGKGRAAVSSPLPRDAFVTCGDDGSVRVWSLDAHKAAAITAQRRAGKREKGGEYPDATGPGAGAAERWTGPSDEHLRSFTVSAAAPSWRPGIESGDMAGDAERGCAPTTGTRLQCVALDAPGRLCGCGDSEGMLRVFDVVRGAVTAEAHLHKRGIATVAFSPPCPEAHTGVPVPGIPSLVGVPSRFIATGGRDQRVRLAPSPTGHAATATLASAKTVAKHDGPVTALAFSAHVTTLISAGDSSLHMTRVHPDGPDIASTTKAVKAREQVCGVAAGPLGRWAATSAAGGRLTLWELGRARALRHFSASGGAVGSATARAAAAGAGATDGADVMPCVAVDPAGLTIATPTSGGIRLVEFVTGTELCRAPAHAGRVESLAFTADCRRLVSVGADSLVIVWRLHPSLRKRLMTRCRDIVDRVSRRAGETTPIVPSMLRTQAEQEAALALVAASARRKGEKDAAAGSAEKGPGGGETARKAKDSAAKHAPKQPAPSVISTADSPPASVSPRKGGGPSGDGSSFAFGVGDTALPAWANTSKRDTASDGAAQASPPRPPPSKWDVPALRRVTSSAVGGGGDDTPPHSAREALQASARSAAAEAEAGDAVLLAESESESEPEAEAEAGTAAGAVAGNGGNGGGAEAQVRGRTAAALGSAAEAVQLPVGDGSEEDSDGTEGGPAGGDAPRVGASALLAPAVSREHSTESAAGGRTDRPRYASVRASGESSGTVAGNESGAGSDGDGGSAGGEVDEDDDDDEYEYGDAEAAGVEGAEQAAASVVYFAPPRDDDTRARIGATLRASIARLSLSGAPVAGRGGSSATAAGEAEGATRAGGDGRKGRGEEGGGGGDDEHDTSAEAGAEASATEAAEAERRVMESVESLRTAVEGVEAAVKAASASRGASATGSSATDTASSSAAASEAAAVLRAAARRLGGAAEALDGTPSSSSSASSASAAASAPGRTAALTTVRLTATTGDRAVAEVDVGGLLERYSELLLQTLQQRQHATEQ